MGHRVVGQRAQRLLAAALVVAVAAGCGASRTFRRAEELALQQQWDEAVEYYRQALQESPDTPEYKIALERAMQSAALVHAQQARTLEAQGQLDEALREYRKASEFDPSNRSIAARAAELDRAAARAARGVAAAAADRAAARPGPQGLAGADPQPDVARPAQPALHQHQPARPAQLHRQCHRHQRHLRPRLPGPHRLGAARGRHPGAGAPAGDAGQPDLLQGAERADDHRRHRQHRQARSSTRSR